jgi:hypothetical protein
MSSRGFVLAIRPLIERDSDQIGTSSPYSPVILDAKSTDGRLCGVVF